MITRAISRQLPTILCAIAVVATVMIAVISFYFGGGLQKAQTGNWTGKGNRERIDRFAGLHPDDDAKIKQLLYSYEAQLTEYSEMQRSISKAFISLGYASTGISILLILILIAQNNQKTEHASPANRHPFGTSVMPPADPASRAGAMPEASGDS